MWLKARYSMGNRHAIIVSPVIKATASAYSLTLDRPWDRIEGNFTFSRNLLRCPMGPKASEAKSDRYPFKSVCLGTCFQARGVMGFEWRSIAGGIPDAAGVRAERSMNCMS